MVAPHWLMPQNLDSKPPPTRPAHALHCWLLRSACWFRPSLRRSVSWLPELAETHPLWSERELNNQPTRPGCIVLMCLRRTRLCSKLQPPRRRGLQPLTDPPQRLQHIAMDLVHRLESMNWINSDQPFAPPWITADESVHRMKPGQRSLSNQPTLWSEREMSCFRWFDCCEDTRTCKNWSLWAMGSLGLFF